MNSSWKFACRGLCAVLLPAVLEPCVVAWGLRGDETALDAPNPAGVLRTVATNGDMLDFSNPFFQSLGTNGRSCVSCHVPTTGWTLSPRELKRRFDWTDGLDPVFRTVDGSNSPAADVSTRARRRRAYSMLLDKGVIRIQLPIPVGAEFSLTGVDDPYNHASAAGLSLFRRPLPATNLRFITGVMWDGRETVAPFGATIGTVDEDRANLVIDLIQQASDATTGHAQALAAPPTFVLRRIVDFELNLATAQQFDRAAGALDGAGALGGAENLANFDFYVTINDALGGDVHGFPFNPDVMSLYDAWADGLRLGQPPIARGAAPLDYGLKRGRASIARGAAPLDYGLKRSRASIARGAALFNFKPIAITGVAGLNDELGVATIDGRCATCHDAPNVGSHSCPLPIDIGLSDASRRGRGMPLYTLKNLATGATIRTTDPGRALITGKWADVNKFKGPVLRGLASRPPYFHNGFADTLDDVVDFYNDRFSVGFTAQERADLVAFLNAL